MLGTCPKASWTDIKQRRLQGLGLRVICLVEDLRGYLKELATQPVRRNAGSMAAALLPASLMRKTSDSRNKTKRVAPQCIPSGTAVAPRSSARASGLLDDSRRLPSLIRQVLLYGAAKKLSPLCQPCMPCLQQGKQSHTKCDPRLLCFREPRHAVSDSLRNCRRTGRLAKPCVYALKPIALA